MRKLLLTLACVALAMPSLRAAGLPETPITPEWKAKMTEKAPAKPTETIPSTTSSGKARRRPMVIM